MATGKSTFESDALSVTVGPLVAAVEHGQVAYAFGWLGITAADGVSGGYVALTIEECEYQFTVPSGLTVNRGDIVYITLANVTNYIPADNAYSTTPGAGKWALFKATSAKGANNVVTGKFLLGV